MTAALATPAVPAPTREDSTRDRLLAAAVAEFREWGYDGTRVSDIARRAGLTTGAIYSCFRGKSDLLAEAIGQASAHGLDDVLTPAAPDAAPDQVLASMGRLLVDGPPVPAGDLVLEAIVAARRDPAVRERLRQDMAIETQDLAGLFVAGKKTGVFDDSIGTREAVTFCVAIELGLVALRSLDLVDVDTDRWSLLIGRLVTALKPSTNGRE